MLARANPALRYLLVMLFAAALGVLLGTVTLDAAAATHEALLADACDNALC